MAGLGNSELVRLSAPGINAKTVAATTIDTTENGTQRFIPIAVVIELTTATSVTVGPTLSIGSNSATYNNIVASGTASLTTVNTLDEPNLAAAGTLPSVAANTAIKVNITVGATATTATIRVDVLGYYI